MRLLCGLIALLGSHGALAAPSVAIFTLEAKTGVPTETAQLLTDNLVEEVRLAGAFSRVISGREIEQMMSFEHMKQVAGCEADSCVAELAGSLGVDFVLSGSLGTLGKSALFNARLSSAKTGSAVSSLSMTLCGEPESLLKAVKPAVSRLLGDAALVEKSRLPAVPMPPTECDSGGPSPVQMGMRAGGLGLFAAAGVGFVLTIAAGAMAAGWFLAITNSPDFVGSIPTGPLTRTPRYIAIVTPAIAGAALAILSVVTGAVLAVAGLGSLAGSAVAE